jgi:hypothetical protein
MLIAQAGCGHEMSYSGLNASLRKINPNIDISNQALAKYFYRQSSVELIRSIYEKIFLFQREKLLCDISKNDSQALSQFNRILIQDSTICVLREQLKAHYKGSGGCASKASLKIDVIHELKTATILKISISAGNKPDISESGAILTEIQNGDLVLRDLGYFKLSILAQFAEKNAFFISRYNPHLNVYLKSDDTSPIKLGSYLQTQYAHLNVIDIDIYLGDAKEKFRLIAYRVPPEISNQRRRKARRNAISKGRTAGEAYLNLFDYVILITNVPREKAKAELIGTIYRVRWNIELIFKTWKSLFNLQLNLQGYKATRIECFVYTILILALLTTIIHGWLKRMGIDVIGEEISLERLSKWLLNSQGYFWLLWQGVAKLEEGILKNLRSITKQKRKRKTTLERVASCECYLEKYDITNI